MAMAMAMAMATSRWSTLPTDILSSISKILNTDVDILRLRSVCSSWRSFVRPRLRPSSFPLKVPRPSPAHSTGGHYYLNYTTIYRLSPPEYGPHAGDPSDGWLFRVSEVNPNCFALLSPMVPIEAKFAPGCIPKFLNLLHYRITEICKCYSLTFVDNQGFVTDLLDPNVEKISVISNDCDFVVFAFFVDHTASYWKYGHKNWTPINTMGNGIEDMMASNGKCYAINGQGILFYFDTKLKLTEIIPHLPPISSGSAYRLLDYKSNLHVVLRTFEEIVVDFVVDDYIVGIPPIPFRSEIFKKCKENWESIRCFPDEAIIFSEDASIVLPLEDFKSSKGNCVHVSMRSTVACPYSGERVIYYGVYDLADAEAAFMKQVEGSKFMSWPPPSWLLSG